MFVKFESIDNAEWIINSDTITAVGKANSVDAAPVYFVKTNYGSSFDITEETYNRISSLLIRNFNRNTNKPLNINVNTTRKNYRKYRFDNGPRNDEEINRNGE